MPSVVSFKKKILSLFNLKKINKMKKPIIVFVLAFCANMGSIFGQDIMTLTSGEEIEVVVTEIDKNNVWYKKFSYLDGPLYSLPKSDIFMIKYPNGDKDVFGVQQAPLMTSYNKKDPAVACIFSVLLPGGGQYYNGQYGKGALMTGLSLASLVGVAVNATNSAYYYDDYGYFRSDSESAFGFFALLYVGTYLWSVIDAPISANKINKQNLLSLNLGKNANLTLQPDMQLTNSFPTGNSFYSPSCGAKLVLSLK
jgi:hypothetical protein